MFNLNDKKVARLEIRVEFMTGDLICSSTKWEEKKFREARVFNGLV